VSPERGCLNLTTTSRALAAKGGKSCSGKRDIGEKEKTGGTFTLLHGEDHERVSKEENIKKLVPGTNKLNGKSQPQHITDG